MIANVSTFEVIIPMASHGVSGFVTSRVSIAEAEAMLSQKVSSHPEVDHEALLTSLDSVGIRQYGGGLPVATVRTGSPAEGAGLRVWDVIVKVGGADVRTQNASAIVKELMKSRNGMNFTVIRSSKTPAGPVEVAKQKKKSKLFGCFSFSSNTQNQQRTGGFAPEKAPAHKTMANYPPKASAPAGLQNIAYNIPINAQVHHAAPAAPPAPNLMQPPKNLLADMSTDNVADFSLVVERHSDKENELGQVGYIFDSDGPVYQPGVIMAY